MSAVKGRVSIYDTMENLGAEVVAFIEKRFAEMYFLCKENIALVKLKPLTELLVEVEASQQSWGSRYNLSWEPRFNLGLNNLCGVVVPRLATSV